MLVLAMEFSRCARHTSPSSARFETGKAETCGREAGVAPAPPRWTCSLPRGREQSLPQNGIVMPTDHRRACRLSGGTPLEAACDPKEAGLRRRMNNQ